MPRKEFIEKAKAALTQQKESSDRSQQIKLHDAEVIKTDGAKKWNALKEEISAIVLTLSETNGPDMELKTFDNQIQITNKITRANVTVRFDPAIAKIDYTGSGQQGGLYPR